MIYTTPCNSYKSTQSELSEERVKILKGGT